MGSSGVVTQLIVFIAIVSTAASVVMIFKGYVDETSYSINLRQEHITDSIKTDIHIEVIHFDNTTTPHTTRLYVRNVGRVLLDPNKFHVYIDGARIPNNASNITISIPSDVDTLNTGYLDPKEVVEITVNKDLDSTVSHEAFVSTDMGIIDSKEYNA